MGIYSQILFWTSIIGGVGCLIALAIRADKKNADNSDEHRDFDGDDFTFI